MKISSLNARKKLEGRQVAEKREKVREKGFSGWNRDRTNVCALGFSL